MSIAHLTPDQLNVIKDHLLMHFMLEHGGSYTMTYEELLQKGTEFDGWGIFLSGTQDSFTVRVTSPDRIHHEPAR